jgi:AcrR family transcriptional regulator
MAYAKSETTAARILDAALGLFRTKGFEETTMRDIATAAGMATGAAYHHFPSKDAMVMAFYRRACDDMQPLLETALADVKGLDRQLVALVRAKLDYFQRDRDVLKALLKNGADPRHPLSPFSSETESIRTIDVSWFRRVLAGVSVPKDLAPHLPDALWLYQMGVIYFWITDASPGQRRTARLLPASARVVTWLIRLSGLPLSRPLRRPVIQLIEIVKEGA